METLTYVGYILIRFGNDQMSPTELDLYSEKLDYICKGSPVQFRKYQEYCLKHKFKGNIDYDYLRGLL